MGEALRVAASEIILGGQKSGKSRRAETLAGHWLAQSAAHKAVMIATAHPWDDEMRARITRHQQDRAERLPRMTTVEEPLLLAQAISTHSRPDTLVVVDCLTLWLTNLLMPAPEFASNRLQAHEIPALLAIISGAVKNCPGPVVLVGNEIGLGVIPMGSEVRAFVDVLGLLNQSLAATCERATLMVAGLPLVLKGAP